MYLITQKWRTSPSLFNAVQCYDKIILILVYLLCTISSEKKQSLFNEIGEQMVFYSFLQQSFSVGTSYAEEWDKNYILIFKNSWVNDDNGQIKQLKRGVYLTELASRARWCDEGVGHIGRSVRTEARFHQESSTA